MALCSHYPLSFVLFIYRDFTVLTQCMIDPEVSKHKAKHHNIATAVFIAFSLNFDPVNPIMTWAFLKMKT